MFEKHILKGQKGIITGGSSGIGLELARTFLGYGAELTITGRNPEKLDKAVQELGPGVIGAAGDVRKAEEVAANFKAHMDKYGRVDFLINNAAGNFLCSLENMTENGFKAVNDIVCLGTFLWSKAVHQQMKQQKSGRIINIGTTYAAFGPATMVGHSGAAKAAVNNLTKTMAVEWGRLGILTNMIAPGAVEGTEGVSRLSAGQMDKMLKICPILRLAQKSEIAQVATFLLSSMGSYINGAFIPVDGGAHLVVSGIGLLSPI